MTTTPTSPPRPPLRRVPTLWLLVAALAVMLAAARCGRDVPLGVDPDSGPAKALDGGAR
ncbi:MAG TPA: hypothetical protein VHL80_15110 [Polyangia bacterium]|nr:hypothetical protein [Polyangia bacterium]